MKGAWRRLMNYVRHDLREIVAPSSLPDPPGVKPERRLTLQEWRQVRHASETRLVLPTVIMLGKLCQHALVC
jgi:hypothetical protein